MADQVEQPEVAAPVSTPVTTHAGYSPRNRSKRDETRRRSCLNPYNPLQKITKVIKENGGTIANNDDIDRWAAGPPGSLGVGIVVVFVDPGQFLPSNAPQLQGAEVGPRRGAARRPTAPNRSFSSPSAQLPARSPARTYPRPEPKPPLLASTGTSRR